MHLMKRLFSSGGQKRADKSRTIEATVVNTASTNSFFKIQNSFAGIPVVSRGEKDE